MVGAEGVDVDVAAVAAERADDGDDFELEGVTDVDDARAARGVDELPVGVAVGARRLPGHARSLAKVKRSQITVPLVTLRTAM